jgi:hypothetical protein
MRTTIWFFLFGVLVDLSCWIPKDRLVNFGTKGDVFLGGVLFLGLILCIFQDFKQLQKEKR